MMGAKYQGWPTAGPDKWVMEWQKLMSDCERWCPAFYQFWASDFKFVWEEVPGAQRLCDRLAEAMGQDDLQDWSIFRVSMELKQAWDHKATISGKIMKAALAVDPRFDGIKASQEEDELEAELTPSSATTNPRKRSGRTQSRHKSRNKRRRRKPCWGCAGDHDPTVCVLIRGSNPRKYKVPEENKKAFEERIRESGFAGKVRQIREAEERTMRLLESQESVCMT
jgi:hypothetical protein